MFESMTDIIEIPVDNPEFIYEHGELQERISRQLRQPPKFYRISANLIFPGMTTVVGRCHECTETLVLELAVVDNRFAVGI